MAQICNPNLLINGDFKVWQRGTSFANISTGYICDRWHVYTEGGTCNYENYNNMLKITLNDNKPTYVIYSFEDIDYLKIIDVPLCITLKAHNNIYSKSFKIQEGDNWLELGGVDSISIVSSFNNSNIQLYIDKNIEIEYIKLELGDKATPFVPRLYAEELALCKRYYEVINIWGSTFVTFTGNGDTRGRLPFKEKRTIPTISPNSIDIVGIGFGAVSDYANKTMNLILQAEFYNNIN